MAKREKQLQRIQERRCRNVKFEELCSLVGSYGFALDRIRGSHHIFKHPGYTGIVNVQKPHPGGDVQPAICMQALRAIQEVIEFDDA